MSSHPNVDFTTVAGILGDAVVSVDDRGSIRLWNPAAERLLGYPASAVRGRPLTMVFRLSADGGHAVPPWAAPPGPQSPVEMRAVHRDGSALDVEVSCGAWTSEGRSFVTVVIRDLSAWKREQGELRRSESRFRKLMENVPAVVYIAGPGPEGRWHYVNSQIEEMLGFTPEEWMEDETLWYRRLHPEDRDRVMLDEETEWAEAPADSQAIEYRLQAKDGRIVWVSDQSYLIMGQEGRPLYWSGFLLDITERKELEEQLLHQALHDPLTGLVNRALFTNRVEHAVDRTDRSSMPPAVVCLDLDDFKTINDSLGHDAGDQLLKHVSACLKECLRAGDTVARFGGDEFAILLDDATDIDDAVALVRRIVERLERPFILGGKAVSVHASFGVAMGEGTRQSPDDLIRNADAALYAAKRRGKSRFELFEPGMHADALWRLELKGDLQRALDRGEFIVHFQPIVDLQARSLVGLESLVRWDHPARGLVPPMDFIPLAEETGLIVPIGTWVLEEACRCVALWQRDFGFEPPLSIAVNVSAKQLQHPEAVSSIRAAIAKSGVAPENVTLEVTESILVKDSDAVITRLQSLKEIGLRIAVDDFGTGYSSLAYLKRFPIDVLKIDRWFVSGEGHGAEDSAILSAIVKLAQSLGMEVVAEGIETFEQLSALRMLGCHRGQGYFFSRPESADAITTLIDKLGVEDWVPREAPSSPF
jgi:diguanylate cyclase (GGDEF)-like protein/PAS domain S-box-containing protein